MAEARIGSPPVGGSTLPKANETFVFTSAGKKPSPTHFDAERWARFRRDSVYTIRWLPIKSYSMIHIAIDHRLRFLSCYQLLKTLLTKPWIYLPLSVFFSFAVKTVKITNRDRSFSRFFFLLLWDKGTPFGMYLFFVNDIIMSTIVISLKKTQLFHALYYLYWRTKRIFEIYWIRVCNCPICWHWISRICFWSN